MSNQMNLVALQCNLTRDAEMKYWPDGKPYLTVSAATNKQWKTADGEKKTSVIYTRWILGGTEDGLGRLAGFFKKGKGFNLIGELKAAGAYLHKETGEPRATLELKLRDFHFLPDSKGATAQADEGNNGDEPPAAGKDEEIPF